MSDMISEAEEAVASLSRDITTLNDFRADLVARLPTLREERTQATRATLLAGAPRKVWQAACQAEQEAIAMLSDMDLLVTRLNHELMGARGGVQHARRQAYMAALKQRLHRIAIENDFSVQEADSLFGDVVASYQYLSTVGRTDEVDRKHAHTYWLDRMNTQVRTRAFILAAMACGDIKIELSDQIVSFGITEYGGKPAALLPLDDAPTPSTNRALITTVKPPPRQVPTQSVYA